MLAIVSQMTAIKSQIPQDTIQTISNGVKTIPDVEETSNNKPAASEFKYFSVANFDLTKKRGNYFFNSHFFPFFRRGSP